MVEARGIRLRGYRRVFRVERRLFRFDRWRIPYPHGVPLRGIGYFLALELCVIALSRLPLLGTLIGLPNPAIGFVGLPLLGSFAAMRGRIDGRPPHHVAVSLIGWWLRPRWLAGLSRCPPEGEELALGEVAVAYDGRESFPVRGRIRGPAKVTFRYPAVVRVQGAPPWLRDPRKRAGRARRYRARRRAGAAPMLRGKVIGVPRGSEVVIE
ncbi:MAG TPA: hypothetical protein VF245_00485 [Solirubrobacterales bacterium]